MTASNPAPLNDTNNDTNGYRPEPVVLTALDGFLLSGTLFLPPESVVAGTADASTTPGSPAGNGPINLAAGAKHKQDSDRLTKVVIISSATATIQDFYYKFAQYLSQELGMIVLTYDNRGVGRSMPNSEDLVRLKAKFEDRSKAQSSPGTGQSQDIKKEAKKKQNPLIGFQATIVDWAMQDLPGVFNFLLERYPKNPTFYVGHSVGGHILPAIDPYYTRNLERCLFVSVTSAYWRNMNSPLFTYWFFYFASPLVNSRYGYYPGKTLWGAMEDLPKGCFETWSYWGSFRDYMLGGNPEWKPNFELFKVPIYSLYFSDDDFSRTSAPHIMELIPNTLRKCVRVDPVKDLNMKKVGHMGFFFNSCKQKLWKTAVKSWFVDGQALDHENIKEQAAVESSYARL
ncbi:hypothetical protein BGW38_007975 [Lunasporangiospora selenospora]|uniref:Alpha/beta hydrolase n=1 Tax=Lunasporangiospora selenospora TaxID=979761 RepID=A0A9P6KGF9_9FUNG|nr:hypothetical protein BGW38_007975 [Lunasporangiospora selenospora]